MAEYRSVRDGMARPCAPVRAPRTWPRAMAFSVLLADDVSSAADYVAAVWTSRNRGEGRSSRPGTETLPPRPRHTVVLWDEIRGCVRGLERTLGRDRELKKPIG